MNTARNQYIYAMKYVYILVSILTLSACKDSTKSDLGKEVVSEISEATSGAISEERIPFLSYSELEPLLQKKNDTTYVVNFWATWCKPCIAELPYFEKINRSYSEKKVKVILVSLDFPKKVESQVLPFIEKNKLQSHIVLLDDPDANSWIPKVDETWSGAIPATLIYKNDSRKFYEKSFTYDELENEIQSIL